MLTKENRLIAERIERSFRERFTTEPILTQSPGRINLIGEHTDYNRGYVLPAAIDKYTVVAMANRTDAAIQIYAADVEAVFTGRIDEPLRPSGNWSDYIMGVVQQFLNAGVPLSGFDLVFGGNVPLGAGVSSSAALECAVAYAINELYQTQLNTLQLVKLAQRAENEFVGVACGIMDQFASMYGKSDHVIRLDCESLNYEYVPFNMDGYKIVLLDTLVKHALGSSEYNVRRAQCEEGLALLQHAYPEITNLRDASLTQLQTAIGEKTQVLLNRCQYIMEENARLIEACQRLAKNDIRGFGELMYQSHHGLSKLYEVSCAELDFLVEQVRSNPAVYGARMMGGGFGGCTINLVEDAAVEHLIQSTTAKYKEHTGISMLAYVVQIGNGTSMLSL